MPSQKMEVKESGDRQPNSNQDVNKPEYMRYLELYKAIDRGDLKATKKFLASNPEARTARLTLEGETALHIAVLSGHANIVEELVDQIDDPVKLEAQNKDENTALIYAATGGIVKIAEYLVTKNGKLVSIANASGHIPVVVASLYGQKEMVKYLYSVTPLTDPHSMKDENGAMLVTTCITDGLYDVALDLLGYHPQLGYTPDTDADTAINVLAQQPSAFPSSSRLAFWEWCLYSCIQINRPCASSNHQGDIEELHKDPACPGPMNTLGSGFHRLLLQDICWKILIFFVPHIMYLYKMKLKHIQAKQLLSRICQQISKLEEKQFPSIRLIDAMFNAVKYGIVEFVVEMTESYPDIIWSKDDQGRNIFLYAVHQRQEKIFNLIYKTGAKKNMLAESWDKKNNSILHQAAMSAPSSQLDRVAGAALQMQRELQWFEEVETLVRPKYKDMVNNSGKTPRELFSEKHQLLVEQGEKWMKDMAESCTVVGALIATMMFAAAFTIPGGYHDNGLAIYLHRNSFMVFIVSDGVSLFTSCISILMFLRILTSRYKEKDFLKSLPTKLMLGLSSLFFSMTTMMIAFGATLFILLKDKVSWAHVPIVVLSSLPVVIFAALQFPVLIEIFYSTYGPGIFDKPTQPHKFSCSKIGKFLRKLFF